MTVNSALKELLPSRGLCLAACAVLALSAACRRDEVTHARVPKESAAPAAASGSMPPMAPGGMSGDVPPPPAPSGADAISWTLPKGWTESRSPGGMRYATLKPPVQGKIDVSVITLPGQAGGELANVNRWRGQIGLPPVEQAALSSARKTIQSPAGEVSLYDFQSEGANPTRMVAGLLVSRGNSWFVKMVGDSGPVSSARADFLRILETLHLGSNG